MTRQPDPRDVSERDLVALADGSLSAARRSRVEQAVAASPELQATVAAQRRALRAVDGAGDEAAPPALRARITLARAPRARHSLFAAVGVPSWAAAAATVAVAALATVLALGGGGPAAPTVADAAVLAMRPAGGAALDHRAEAVTFDRPRADGLAFPYWEDRFGWKAVGARRDELAGRAATTVFYLRGGERVAYTIVGGPPLAVGAATRSTTSAGVRLRSLRFDGRRVVSWLRRGHTCVLSATGTPVSVLLRLASWKARGRVPY